jgi:hypothetical protein
LRGHVFPLELIGLSPDGRFAATASRDETVRLWHVETGRELLRWSTGLRWMDSLGFSSTGDVVYAEGEGRNLAWAIERVNWPLAKAVEFTCAHLLAPRQRTFTTEERENDPLVREVWAQSRAGAAEDVCHAALAQQTAGSPARAGLQGRALASPGK